MTGVENSKAPFAIRSVRRKLFKLCHLTRLVPIPFFNGRRLPGSSMHFGGSFPMVKDEMVDQSNTNSFGELCQLKNVHLVDGSVLPDIPAGSFTLTIMANAYRIGAEVEFDSKE